MAFMRQQAMRGYSPRELLNQQYNASRNNLLLVLAFTVVNCVFALLGEETYFLFSAFVPYYALVMGMVLCGKMPPEFYGDEAETFPFYGDSFLVIMGVIAAVCLVFYILSWVFSKNHKVGWVIFALVFFSIDTILMFLLGGIDLGMIFDYLFHAWVLFELARGIYVHNKWKNMSNDPEVDVDITGTSADGTLSEDNLSADSTPLRAMDRDAKSRTFVETEYQGHKILYRKANKVNELIVDGMVYDEFATRLEVQHQLYTRIDGHDICAIYNGAKCSITVDGMEVASKVRWY